MTRTKYSIKNIKYSLAGQISNLIMSFIVRTVFVYYLGAEYLGLNGLFTNVLSILSLAELGIGSAITYSIYDPLSNGDEKKLKALMQIFKKAYISIGIWMAISGIILTPFLDVFIKDMPNIPYINVIYLLFLINSAITYFFSYKRALLIADQKKYIDSLYHFSALFILNIVQIFVLIFTQNYLFFLTLTIISNFSENFLISFKVNKMYPFLKENVEEKLEKKEKKIIIRNIKAMFLHRVGSIVVMGTDNLLISKFVGIISVGIYSNYLLIINALQTIFGVIFQSLTASIGNLGATENSNRIKEVFNAIDFIGYWIYGFASIALFNLLNPFIQLWLGDKYLFESSIILLIVLNFYIQGQRKSVLTFRDALGLFWYDRYKPFFESIINLILSIYLVINFGVAGVLLGTVLSTLTTATWVEPYILYKYGLKTNVTEYLIKYIKRVVLTATIGTITFLVCNLVTSVSVFGFILRLIISTLIPNLILIFIYYKSNEFKYVVQIINKFIPITKFRGDHNQ